MTTTTKYGPNEDDRGGRTPMEALIEVWREAWPMDRAHEQALWIEQQNAEIELDYRHEEALIEDGEREEERRRGWSRCPHCGHLL